MLNKWKNAKSKDTELLVKFSNGDATLAQKSSYSKHPTGEEYSTSAETANKSSNNELQFKATPVTNQNYVSEELENSLEPKWNKLKPTEPELFRYKGGLQYLQNLFNIQFESKDTRCLNEEMRSSISGSTDLELVRRVRKKFENLEQSCMERYQTREEKVMSTLEFCMTALEQLRSWAVFAIFPTDENQKEKYMQFVQQRYNCVIEPLRLFLSAIERCKSTSEPIKSRRYIPRDRSYERARERESHSSRDLKTSPRDLRRSGYYGLGGDISIQRGNRFKTQPESPRLGHPQKPPPLDLANLDDQNESETASTSGDAENEGSLRDEINRISREHSEEGAAIKESVMEKLKKCRKDTKTLYKWGQASLLDLHDVLDEALADELYFMVRSKMARILSTISVFEEAAEQIERSLSNHFQNNPTGSISERGTSSTGKVKRQVPQIAPQAEGIVRDTVDLSSTSSTMTSQKSDQGHDRMAPTDGSSNPSNSGRFEDLNDLDLRIEIPSRDSPTGSEGNELEDLLLSWSFNGGNIGQVRLAADKSELVERQSEASTPRSGSTPEPPISPRPRALVNHPKIMKDKLHSMALPSKFPGVVSGRCSASW